MDKGKLTFPLPFWGKVSLQDPTDVIYFSLSYWRLTEQKEKENTDSPLIYSICHLK